MTANPALGTRTVVLPNRWPESYFPPLMGMRMPALVADRVYTGVLVAVSETPETVTLTFSDLAPED